MANHHVGYLTYSNTARTTNGDAFGLMKGPGQLERLLGDVNMTFRTVDGLDQGKTNYHRIRSALELGPVIRRKGKYFFRKISIGNDGLMNVDYSENVPGFMASLSSDEKIQKIFAVQYLGIDQQELNQLITHKKVRGMKKYAGLDSLNDHKCSIQEKPASEA